MRALRRSAPPVVSPVITELQAAGAMSLRDIATGPNERGIPTARGAGTWSATQVRRVLARRKKPSHPQCVTALIYLRQTYRTQKSGWPRAARSRHWWFCPGVWGNDRSAAV